MINLIWAMTERGVIGKNNRIPWHIKEDLLYYKSKTKGKTVLMGEATYHSLKGYYKDKPLPYGHIYVASLTPQFVVDDAETIKDVTSFLKGFKDELWVVGGRTIYQLALPYADRLYISYVQKEYDGDTYFPTIDFSLFKNTWEHKTELVNYTLFERVESK